MKNTLPTRKPISKGRKAKSTVRAKPKRSDRIVSVNYSRNVIRLEFEDGLSFTNEPSILGMPVDKVVWKTLKTDGKSLTVNTLIGEEILISAQSVRCLVDQQYGQKLRKRIDSIRPSRKELAELAKNNPPPPEWYEQPAIDLTRKSWK